MKPSNNYWFTGSMSLCFILIIVVFSCKAPTKKQKGDIILNYSFANDSFLIRVTNVIYALKPSDTVHVVYYSDESLKSGKLIEKMISSNRDALLKKKYVFVGIAHFGFFRPKRRRDFISPSIKVEDGYKGRNPTYGQADSFYHFLKNYIIPAVEKRFSNVVIKRSFIGHSLGGLFATYLLINGDTLFNQLYALSPSLWIDNYHILAYENLQKGKIKNARKGIWISCGSFENLNKIVDGVHRIGDTLKVRNYPMIKYQIKVYAKKTHNSSVAPALDDIFGGL